MKYNTTWFTQPTISEAHQTLPIRQVYCWLVTTDKKIVVVSKDNKKWQFPGGHPEPNETQHQTLTREVQEETNIDISAIQDQATFFGYYLVENIAEDGQVIDRYLQIRFFLNLPSSSTAIDLKTNERSEDTETVHMQFVQAFTLAELFDLIPWLESSQEYQTIKEYII